MRQVIEKSFLDWSRDKNQRIQARGVVALLNQKAKIVESAKVAGTTRCVWPSSYSTDSSRYLSRRVWMG